MDVLKLIGKRIITASSSDSSERMFEAEPEVNQHCEKEDPFTRYLNPYI
jgi:hypothetical protein